MSSCGVLPSPWHAPPRCSSHPRPSPPDAASRLQQADTGVVLQLLGFSDKLAVLAGAVSATLAAFGGDCGPPEPVWEVVLEVQERKLRNAVSGGQPHSQAALVAGGTWSHGKWGVDRIQIGSLLKEVLTTRAQCNSRAKRLPWSGGVLRCGQAVHRAASLRVFFGATHLDG